MESFSVFVQECYLFLPVIVLNDCGVAPFQLQQHLYVKLGQTVQLKETTLDEAYLAVRLVLRPSGAYKYKVQNH